jgi:hypothetical protein
MKNRYQFYIQCDSRMANRSVINVHSKIDEHVREKSNVKLSFPSSKNIFNDSELPVIPEIDINYCILNRTPSLLLHFWIAREK